MKKGTLARAAVIIACALVILALGLMVVRRFDQEQYAETRSEMSDGFGQLRTVAWRDAEYREKPAVTTILLAGIDKTEDSVTTAANEYRNGGQADFLLLLAIDHTDKKIHQLQIDRDTMTDVVTLGVFGNETGTRNMQICLAHGFGKTPQDNARYTIRAVRNLLEGIEIDGYYMISYTAIPILNDTLGGVTVHIADDMTSVNPAWTKGAEVTLRGKEAESFVRARMGIGEGSNRERMVRQNEFMQQALSQMNRKTQEDLTFGETLIKSLQQMAVTNLTVRQLEEELNKAYGYMVLPVDHPAGSYCLGEDGFVEFHMQEGAAVEWVLEHMYIRQ